MPSELSVKQQREARRAEKVAVLKKQQAKQKRNRLITLIGSIAASAGVLTLVIVFVITSSTPKVDPSTIDVAGVTTFDDLTAVHVADGTAVDYEADYGMNPPAGGNHWQYWLNCGVYTEPQQNENAVHALEHGAVWITYDPELVSAEDIETMRADLPDTYMLISPYPGLQAPVVASAWGNQVELEGIDDPRLGNFVTKFWRSADVPEPTAVCSGAIDGPGKIA
jgi:hypothetical protein